jgi:hypothetical protein
MVSTDMEPSILYRTFLKVLGGFEALERLPTRSVTGYFVAARYTSYA